MSIAKEKLESALSAIKKDGDGAYLQNRFQSVATQTSVNAAEGPRKRELRDPYYFAAQDFDNLLTIALRLDWQKEMWTKDDLDDIRWIRFVEADVSLFHVEFRSLFDYLATIIRHVSHKSGQVRTGESGDGASFRKLRNWTMESDENAKRLGADLAAIVKSCDWFDGLREVRDTVVHRGGSPTAFIEDKDRVLFQINDRNFREGILLEEVMYRDNIVDFERYAGLHFGYLLDLLDEVGGAIHRRLELEDRSDRITYRHPALDLVQRWIEFMLD